MHVGSSSSSPSLRRDRETPQTIAYANLERSLIPSPVSHTPSMDRARDMMKSSLTHEQIAIELKAEGRVRPGVEREQLVKWIALARTARPSDIERAEEMMSSASPRDSVQRESGAMVVAEGSTASRVRMSDRPIGVPRPLPMATDERSIRVLDAVTATLRLGQNRIGWNPTVRAAMESFRHDLLQLDRQVSTVRAAIPPFTRPINQVNVGPRPDDWMTAMSELAVFRSQLQPGAIARLSHAAFGDLHNTFTNVNDRGQASGVFIRNTKNDRGEGATRVMAFVEATADGGSRVVRPTQEEIRTLFAGRNQLAALNQDVTTASRALKSAKKALDKFDTPAASSAKPSASAENRGLQKASERVKRCTEALERAIAVRDAFVPPGPNFRMIDLSYEELHAALADVRRALGWSDAQLATCMLAMMGVDPHANAGDPETASIGRSLMAKLDRDVTLSSAKVKDVFDARTTESRSCTIPARDLALSLMSIMFLTEPKHALPMAIANQDALSCVARGVVSFDDLMEPISVGRLGAQSRVLRADDDRGMGNYLASGNTFQNVLNPAHEHSRVIKAEVMPMTTRLARDLPVNAFPHALRRFVEPRIRDLSTPAPASTAATASSASTAATASSSSGSHDSTTSLTVTSSARSRTTGIGRSGRSARFDPPSASSGGVIVAASASSGSRSERRAHARPASASSGGVIVAASASPSTASSSGSRSASRAHASPSTASLSTASLSTASLSTASLSTASPATASPATASPATASPATASATASLSTASPATASSSGARSAATAQSRPLTMDTLGMALDTGSQPTPSFSVSTSSASALSTATSSAAHTAAPNAVAPNAAAPNAAANDQPVIAAPYSSPWIQATTLNADDRARVFGNPRSVESSRQIAMMLPYAKCIALRALLLNADERPDLTLPTAELPRVIAPSPSVFAGAAYSGPSVSSTSRASSTSSAHATSSAHSGVSASASSSGYHGSASSSAYRGSASSSAYHGSASSSPTGGRDWDEKL